jgi:hypothetical protein
LSSESTPLSTSSILTLASRTSGTDPALDDVLKREALGTITLGDGPGAGESGAMLSWSSVDNPAAASCFLFGFRELFGFVAARGGGGA